MLNITRVSYVYCIHISCMNIPCMHIVYRQPAVTYSIFQKQFNLTLLKLDSVSYFKMILCFVYAFCCLSINYQVVGSKIKEPDEIKSGILDHSD